MRTTRVLDVIDRVTDGALTDQVRQLRAEGATLQDVVFAIRDQFGVVVSPSSVVRWEREQKAA